MAQLPRKVEINIASIPVAGFGGACMVVASIICAAALPQTRWFMLAALVAGIMCGAAMIFMRRVDDAARPSHDDQPPSSAERVSMRRRSRGEPTIFGRLRAARI